VGHETIGHLFHDDMNCNYPDLLLFERGGERVGQ
jgi:hypothetical protein